MVGGKSGPICFIPMSIFSSNYYSYGVRNQQEGELSGLIPSWGRNSRKEMEKKEAASASKCFFMIRFFHVFFLLLSTNEINCWSHIPLDKAFVKVLEKLMIHFTLHDTFWPYVNSEAVWSNEPWWMDGLTDYEKELLIPAFLPFQLLQLWTLQQFLSLRGCAFIFNDKCK